MNSDNSTNRLIIEFDEPNELVISAFKKIFAHNKALETSIPLDEIPELLQEEAEALNVWAKSARAKE